MIYWLTLFSLLFFTNCSYPASVADLQNQLAILNKQLQQLTDALSRLPAVQPTTPDLQKIKQQLDKIIEENYKKNQGITKKLLDDYENLLTQYRKKETDQSKVKDYVAWKYRGLLSRYGFVPRSQALSRYRIDFETPQARTPDLLDTYEFWFTTYVKNAPAEPESRDFVQKTYQWIKNLKQTDDAIRGMDVIMTGFDPNESKYLGYPSAPGKPFPQELFDQYEQYLKIAASALGQVDPMVVEYRNNIPLLADKIGTFPEIEMVPGLQPEEGTLTKAEFAALRNELRKEKKDFDQNWQNWTRSHWLEVLDKLELFKKNLPMKPGEQTKTWPSDIEQFYIDLNTKPIPPQ